VEVRNSGAEPLQVPNYFLVQAVLPSGEEYVPPANDGLLVLPVPDEYTDDPPLAPGAKRVLYVPLGESLDAPGIFGDPHFFEPGTYSFQLLMDDRHVHGGKPVLDPVLVTPAVRFTVAAGSPADVRVWEALMLRTGNRPLAARSPRVKREIAIELLPLAESSGYHAHLLLAKGADRNEEWISLLREAIPLLGDHPFLADRLQALLIAAHERASLSADVARKLRLANRAARVGRSGARRLPPPHGVGRATRRAASPRTARRPGPPSAGPRLVEHH
jgi:hypothetical protein